MTGLVPRILGRIASRTGTPAVGLTITLLVALLLLVSGQVSLVLNIAVFALVLLYLLHSTRRAAAQSRSASVAVRDGVIVAVELAGDAGVEVNGLHRRILRRGDARQHFQHFVFPHVHGHGKRHARCEPL